jgi:beta-lactamase class D
MQHGAIEMKWMKAMRAQWFGNSLAIAALLTLAMAFAVADTGTSKQGRLAEWFDQYGVRGSMLLCDATLEHCETHNPQRARQRFSPASTFKIVNALIGLEEGAVGDEHEVMKWDGSKQRISAWERDHNLASAMRVSAVWFYQSLARRIGRERMQYWLDRLAYGNHRIGSREDFFWLDGSLTVSAEEQLELLRGLHDGTLPFSGRSQRIVREILVRARGDDFVVHAKTGWNDTYEVGWFVGWVQRGDVLQYFAMNIDVHGDEDAAARVDLVEDVLEQRGLIPPGTELE